MHGRAQRLALRRFWLQTRLTSNCLLSLTPDLSSWTCSTQLRGKASMSSSIEASVIPSLPIKSSVRKRELPRNADAIRPILLSLRHVTLRFSSMLIALALGNMTQFGPA